MPGNNDGDKHDDDEHDERVRLAFESEPEWNLAVVDYLEKQDDLNPSMRNIVVAWMMDVCYDFRLMRETMCLALMHFDRYMALCADENIHVARQDIQLCAVTCLVIVAKVEEVDMLDIKDYAQICSGAYTCEQITRMEIQVLHRLGFRLHAPSRMFFLNHYLALFQTSKRCRCLAYFLSEMAFICYEMLKYPSSLVALCCVCLARETLGQHAWPAHIATHLRYSTDDPCFRKCLCEIYKIHYNARTNKLASTIHRRFAGETACYASGIAALPQAHDE